MNNSENKPKYGLSAIHPSHFKYVSVDKEQCEENDVPINYWYKMYQSIRLIKQNINILKEERNNIINWLEKLEDNKNVKNELKEEIRKNAVERIYRIDTIFNILYKENLMMEKLEEELFWFLPHKEVS